MRGRLIALAVLSATVIPAGSALSALPAGAASASGSIGIRLIAAPNGSDLPFARIYIVGRMPPGTTVRRQVEITNATQSTADIAVYAAGATIVKGRFIFAAGRSQDELSSWTSVSSGSLHLLAGTKAIETVTMNVPKVATSGERYAVVWAEVSTAAGTGGVTLVNRVGVRMYVSIGAGGAPPPDFAIGALKATRLTTGEPIVTAAIRNNGQQTLDISGVLKLSNGPGGISTGPSPVMLGVALVPGGTEMATVRLDKALPSGPWRADMRLVSGLVHRAATATISFPGKAVVAPAGSVGLIVIVVVLLLILLLLALAVVALMFRRRRVRTAGTP